jgi:hypothetical protein
MQATALAPKAKHMTALTLVPHPLMPHLFVLHLLMPHTICTTPTDAGDSPRTESQAHARVDTRATPIRATPIRATPIHATPIRATPAYATPHLYHTR